MIVNDLSPSGVPTEGGCRDLNSLEALVNRGGLSRREPDPAGVPRR